MISVKTFRDAKGRRHFSVVIKAEKKADLKDLQAQIGSAQISFASEERLMKHLGLTKGAVSPLGVINDKNAEVEVYYDRDLIGNPCIGVHPNDNTATVWISFEDLQRFIKSNGNEFGFVSL